MNTKDIKLSKNFSLSEFTRTSSSEDNTPNEEQIEAIRLLVEVILQPLRDLYGKPIRINSGFRSSAVNSAIGGADSSQHSKGEAVDITGGSVEENQILFDLIVENFPFDQIIDEFGMRWVHVSYRKNRLRRQKLRAVKKNGRTIYEVIK